MNNDEVDNNGRVIHLRGFDDWAPPRKQWIFSLHAQCYRFGISLFFCKDFNPLHKRKIYARRMRYCDYFGRLFCQRCHQGSKTKTPARIIHQWNFKEYPVCDMAYRFLSDNYFQPVINASAIFCRFYNNSRSLKKLHDLRIQLVHIWSYIKTCELAKTVQTNLNTMFTSVPNHYLTAFDVFSLSDLENIENGELFRLIHPLVQYGQLHIENCERCKAKAFICELCAEDDLLFPFQLNKIYRCNECGSLFHGKCAKKLIKSLIKCPKCIRIEINLLVFIQFHFKIIY
ncbi:unnamed protein product [Dracunculus medinensis]|uniref:Rubicon Homology domain-containing protein n=1 Tax=Dracunculus medinensis TaxID=318479 RepID=A0A3P7PBT6_DRAME|nr:unnamed protein product [Dracunculus medinensis]